jgi:hypothetical protein
MQQSEPMPNSAEAPDGGKNISPEPQFVSSVGPGVQIAGAACAHKAADIAPPPARNGSQPVQYVYALGTVEPRFPRLAVEKEFAQATGRAETAGLTDRAALKAVLSQRQNRYLIRELCWVLTIEGLETYLLVPHDPADFELLLETLRSTPRATDVDVIIGVKGPLAPPEFCNGLLLPIVRFDQIYSFDVETFTRAIPRPDSISEEQFRPAAEEVFSRIMQMADNAGATDHHRALNYLATRYPSIYSTTAAAHSRTSTLTAIDVRPSQLNGVRKMVDVIFSYTHRQTDVLDKYFARVDVTEQFPFLASKMSPYYECQ